MLFAIFVTYLLIHNHKIMCRSYQKEVVRIEYSIGVQTSLHATQVRYFEIRSHKDEMIGEDETSYTNDSTW